MLLGPASDVAQAVKAPPRPGQARPRPLRHLGVDTVVEIVDHLDHKSTFHAAPESVKLNETSGCLRGLW